MDEALGFSYNLHYYAYAGEYAAIEQRMYGDWHIVFKEGLGVSAERGRQTRFGWGNELFCSFMPRYLETERDTTTVTTNN